VVTFANSTCYENVILTNIDIYPSPFSSSCNHSRVCVPEASYGDAVERVEEVFKFIFVS